MNLRSKARCFLLCFTFIAGSTVAAAQSPNPTFWVMDVQLSATVLSEPHSRVIRSNEEFRKFWNELYLEYEWKPKMPRVDFRSEMVLAISLVNRSSGGYGLTVRRLKLVGREVRVHSLVTVSGQTCMTTAAISTQVKLVRLERHNVPFRFVFEELVNECR